jgi:hypothetical protein
MNFKAAVAATALLIPLLGACEEKPESQASETSPEPASSAKPAVDSKLSNAMQAAAKETAAPSAVGSAGAASGPPQNGVMTLTQADNELARHMPSVLTLGAKGSPPLIKLGPGRLAPGARASGTLEVSVRTGPRSAMPTLVFELDGTSKDEGSGHTATTFKIKKASLSSQQPGTLPDGLAAEIVKVQGSSFSTLASANGANTGVSSKLAPGGEDFEPILTAGNELLQSILVPYPDEPVGVGGYWMVKSRELFHGAEVVAYRLIKVTEVDGQKAKLSLETRRYAVGQSLGLAGLPPHSLIQFDGSGQGQLSIAAGAALPEEAQLNDTLNAVIAQNGDTQRQAPIQLVAQGIVAFPGKH